MAAIERTAYPRFKRHPSGAELRELYTPTDAELAWAEATTAKRPSSMLALLVLLKGFQRLGCLPRLVDVPSVVVAHIRACARLGAHIQPEVTARTLYRHHHAIRLYLDVTGWGAKARHVAVEAAAEAAEVLDHPADLINVAIEALVRGRFELPAFSTLDRLARRVRTVVNQRLFAMVSGRLTPDWTRRLNQLLDPPAGAARSPYNRLKQPPRRPTLSHFAELLEHLAWLERLGDPALLLAGLPPGKLAHFAAEANALDAAELKDHTPPKRFTLLVCGCGGDLTLGPVVGVEARQVFDLPEVRLWVGEHRAERRACACGQVTAGVFPEQARAAACYGPGVRGLGAYLAVQHHVPVERAAQVLGDALGAGVSAGMLAGLPAEAAGGLGGFVERVREQLVEAEVAHFDETVRREAPGDRVGVKGLHRWAVAAAWLKLRAA